MLLLPQLGLATPGDLDRSFAGGVGRVMTNLASYNDYAQAMALDADGKALVVGYSGNGTDFDVGLVRFGTDGLLDTSFDSDGIVMTPVGAGDDGGFGIAVQSDGKIVVAGYTYNGTDWDVLLLRYNSDGSLDTSFDSDGIVTTAVGPGNDYGLSLALQSDGKILVGGYSSNGTDLDFMLLRYTTAGALDTGFGTSGKVITSLDVWANDALRTALAVQGDGKILQAGTTWNGTDSDFTVLRYNTNGSLDTGFDFDGIVTTDIAADDDDAYAIAIQTDGKIVVAGGGADGVAWDFAVVRYNDSDGSLDTGFDTDGIVTTRLASSTAYAYGVTTQSDGKIVVAGSGRVSSVYRFVVARYNSDGSLDTGFDGDSGTADGVVSTALGTDDRPRAVALQSDGRIVVAGFSSNGSNADYSIASYSINYDPVVTSTAVTTADEDSAYSYSVTASDVEASPLTFTATTKPSWLTLTDHGDGTATLAGTPLNDDVGDNSVTLEVSDGTDPGTQSFTITVNNTNDVPVIGSAAVTSVNEDALYSYTFTASDVDVGDSLTLSAPVKPAWLSFNAGTGVLSGTPTNDEVGTFNVTLRVNDGTVDVDQSFTVTVVNTNDDAVISSSPVTAATEDSAYSYTIAASDVDVGDVLSYSAPVLPAWLSFNPSTQELSGTPLNDHVGANAVTLRVSDGTSNVDQSFTITVTNTNDSPTGLSLSTSSVAENNDPGSALPVGNVVVADVDVGDTHGLVISGGADAASFELSGAVLQFKVGVALDYETKTSYEVEVTATDSGAQSVAQTVTVSVINVNEAPTLSAVADQNVDINGSSASLAVTVGDVDTAVGTLVLSAVAANDTLLPSNSFAFSGQDANRSFVITPATNEYGTTQVTLTVSDGQLSASVNFSVTVFGTDSESDGIPDVVDTDDDNDGMSDAFETANGFDPLDPSDAALDADGDGLTNLQEFLANKDPSVDDNPPQITPPQDITMGATGLFSSINLGSATAVDAIDGQLTPSASFSGPFESGTTLVTWSATDRAGNTGTAVQSVHVLPRADFGVDQSIGEGGTVTLRVRLSGDPPAYPVTIPFTVGGTAANPSDHNLAAGTVTIASGREQSLTFSVVQDSQREGSETVIVTMGTPSGAVPGVRSRHTVTIVEDNVAPRVALTVSQGGSPTSLVVLTGGPVTLSAQIADPNPNDTHQYNWSESDNSLVDTNGAPELFVFNPATLSPGVYRAVLTVTDSGVPTARTHVHTEFRVTNIAPSLGSTDSDGDGATDAAEGYGDIDSDRIADYLDAIDAANVLQGSVGDAEQYLLETDPGLQLRLGRTALGANTGSGSVTAGQITTWGGRADSIANVGGYVDFEISGLVAAGDAARIVLPQHSAIPANAVYRKLMPSGWQDFIVDTNNAVASSAGERGYCPAPGDSSYTSGLTAGHWCVQLTIEDGGRNDADGLADGVITDPGGVAQRTVQADTGGDGGGGGGGGADVALLGLIVLLGWRGYRTAYGRTQR